MITSDIAIRRYSWVCPDVHNSSDKGTALSWKKGLTILSYACRSSSQQPWTAYRLAHQPSYPFLRLSTCIDDNVVGLNKVPHGVAGDCSFWSTPVARTDLNYFALESSDYDSRYLATYLHPVVYCCRNAPRIFKFVSHPASHDFQLVSCRLF